METQKLSQTASPDQVLAEYIRGLGLPLFGFTSGEAIRRFQPWYDGRPPEAVSPFETGEPAARCDLSGQFISIAFPYAHELVWPEAAHFSVYVRGPDYHGLVRGYLERIAGFIRGLGYAAQVHVDASPLPERLIAALAGVGWLGRNSTLITEDYGSYVFLGEIQTDLPLPEQTDFVQPGDFTRCGSCHSCLLACPVHILGGEYVPTRRCLSSLTQQKTREIRELRLMDGRLFGCDSCQMVCPCNADKAHTGMSEFKPFDYMVQPDLMELTELSKSSFREKYAVTAAGWRGKSVLAVNALAALRRLDSLPEGFVAGSPLVQAAYDTLNHDPLEDPNQKG